MPFSGDKTQNPHPAITVGWGVILQQSIYQLIT